MITAYTEENQECKIKEDKLHINTLCYAHNLFKLMPYPEVQHISFCINPKIIDRKKFEDLQRACLDFDNVLVDLYNNFPQLIKFYEEYASGDEFLGLLLKIYKRVKSKGFNRNKPIIFINRNDFMYDRECDTFLEIEYNLIAASMGFHSHNLNKMLHQYYTLHRHKKLQFVESNYPSFHLETFVKFWSYYANPHAYVGILLSDQEGNIFETIQIEQLLLDAGIKTVRINANDIINLNFHLDDSNNLVFKGKEIGIVYLRYLYDPSHYTDDIEEFMYTAELSNAMCIPSIEMLLINMKLSQFLLCNAKAQEKYDIPKIDLRSFANHICPHYILRDNFNNDKEKMISEVKKDINSYLLKTFKEGGYGDIIAGESIIDLINKDTIEHLNTYMLVHRVKTPTYPSYVWYEGELKYFNETISEFSIYTGVAMKMNENGVWVMDWHKGTENLVRTKPVNTLKGGVAVNAAFIDSLIYKD